MNRHSAAHRTTPLGTLIKVRNPDNGISITLRINDRGPYIPGRDLDLSRQAAQDLGILHQGVAPVVVRVFTDKDFYFYTFQKKDTLWKLFHHRWRLIADLNRVIPEQIKPGTKLKVPYI